MTISVEAPLGQPTVLHKRGPVVGATMVHDLLTAGIDVVAPAN
jgi:hypothetical protein